MRGYPKPCRKGATCFERRRAALSQRPTNPHGRAMRVPMWFLRLRAYTVERVTGTLKTAARIAENLNFFCKTGGSAAGYATRRGGSVFRRSARGYRQVAAALDFFIKGERHPYLPAPASGWDERHFPGYRASKNAAR